MDRGSLARYPNILLGIWLMAAPAVLGYSAPASTNDHIVGPLVITFATVAIWETTRELRRANLALGVWLLIAPWLLGYPTVATVNSMVVGALIIPFALIRGEITEQFGGGWSALWTNRGTNGETGRR